MTSDIGKKAYAIAYAISMEAFIELFRATKIHGPMRGAHEGHSVIREEFEELWDEVKLKKPNIKRMRKEAIQLAAMALRFVMDVCDKEAE